MYINLLHSGYLLLYSEFIDQYSSVYLTVSSIPLVVDLRVPLFRSRFHHPKTITKLELDSAPTETTVGSLVGT